MNFSLQLSWN